MNDIAREQPPMTSCDSNTVEVQLRPFKHQVGGHTCVLEVTKSVICKPYVEKEVWFYQNEPEELKDFTPKYLGDTLVSCDIQNDFKCLVAAVPESIVNKQTPTHLDGLEDTGLDDVAKRPTKKRRRSKTRTNPDPDNINKKEKNLEAWSATCIDRQITRYGFWANNQPQPFILLENLVYQYQRPCLMDLKMGRRQFGDDSNEEKRKLLQSRCASTTSATLGFRICGSQSFKIPENTYVFHDKYVGRNLDTNGAKEELSGFFYNGLVLRVDVIRKILQKLEMLRKILMTQDMFFYSVSLLLLYDGAMPRCSEYPECNTETKSVQNCGEQKCGDVVEPSAIDSILPKEDSKGPEGMTIDLLSQGEVFNHPGPNDKAEDSSSSISNTCSSVEFALNNVDSSDVKVDVRMIDFAHVSQRPTDVKQESNFADETIVFGLNHLHEMLTDILRENCANF